MLASTSFLKERDWLRTTRLCHLRESLPYATGTSKEPCPSAYLKSRIYLCSLMKLSFISNRFTNCHFRILSPVFQSHYTQLTPWELKNSIISVSISNLAVLRSDTPFVDTMSVRAPLSSKSLTMSRSDLCTDCRSAVKPFSS